MKSKKNTSIKVSFGDHIRTLRKARGLSQEALAIAADLDRSYIGGVERGERNISIINIEKIAYAFELSITELFKGLK